MKKISVITVSFNSEKTIERTIKSVIDQKCENLEYIIIDGGSKDGTLKIIEHYQRYITKYISEKDDGIYDAMNKGVRLATGDIIAFLNSDDYYVSGALNRIENVFDSENYDILCGRIYCEKNQHRWLANGAMREKPDNLLDGMMVYNQPAMFVRHDIFSDDGLFKTNYKIASDYEWMLNVWCHGARLQLDNFVYTVFSCEGVSSTNLEMTAIETFHIANDYLDKLKGEIPQEKFEAHKENIVRNTKIKLMKAKVERGKLPYSSSLVQNGRYSVFGAGEIGILTVRLMKMMNLDIVAVWDNNKNRWGEVIEGIEIKNPKEIENFTTTIIVASQIYFKEIMAQLDDIRLRNHVDYWECTDFFSKVIGDVDG